MSHAPLLCAALVRSFGSRTAILRKQLTQLGVLLAAFLCIHLQGAARAQSGSLDLTFGTHTQEFVDAPGPVYAVAEQSDGKVIVVGDWLGGVARFQPDGGRDTSFLPVPGDGSDGTVYAVAVQPDGKILIGGDFYEFGGVPRACIVRLNIDGSVDPTFDTANGFNGPVHAIVILPDGRIVLGGNFTSYGGVSRSRIARLDADGTLDSTFANGANGEVLSLALQSDGKLLVGGHFTTIAGVARNRIARINADSTLDTNFVPGTGANAAVRVVRVLPDGNVLLAGSFTSYNTAARGCIARVSPTGALDTTFANGANFSILAMTVQTDGKILLGGDFTTFAGFSRNRFARINSDSTLDLTFTTVSGADSWIEDIAVLSSGKILAGGNFTMIDELTRRYIARFDADGSISGRNTGPNTGLRMIARQPDGKVLIAGGFTTVHGTPRSRIARLNTDGSVDSSFDTGVGPNDWIHKFALQSDGKIVIVGGFTSVSGVARNRVARLNADGSLDATFNPGTGANDWLYAVLVQPDGKILIGGGFTTFNGSARNRIVRLNTNGALDPTFSIGTGANEIVYALALQPDGRILIGGFFTTYAGTARARLARLTSTGGLDTSFVNPAIGAAVYDIAIAPDAKVFVSGIFSTVGASSSAQLARLNSNGSLDSTFALATSTAPAFAVHDIELQPDGKLLFGGTTTYYGGRVMGRLARLNSNGSFDTSFNPGAGANAFVYSLDLQPDGSILVAGDFSAVAGVVSPGFARILGDTCSADIDGDGTADCTDGCPNDPGKSAPGVCGCGVPDYDGDSDGTPDCNDLCPSDPEKIAPGVCGCGIADADTDGDGTPDCLDSGGLDLTFGAPLLSSEGPVHAPGTVFAAVRQPDGKILIGGGFGVARLRATGSPDSSFEVGAGANNVVYALAIQPDGKVLIGGNFTSYNGTARNRIARLNADGSLDTSFSVGTGADGSVDALALQADGKVLIGGLFTTYNGTARNYIARLNADGSLDTSFSVGTGANFAVYAVALQPDGKVLIGGNFSSYNGTARSSIARLNANGSLDTSFSVGTGANSLIEELALQADGKVLIGGAFTTYNGTARNYIARLNANGSLDTSFNVGTGANDVVRALAVQPDGKVVIGGQFTTYNGTARSRIARLNANGSLDTSFNLGTGANDGVYELAMQPDGKVLIGGNFTSFNGVRRDRIALLNSDGSLSGPTTSLPGTNSSVRAMASQSDGKVLIGGEFTTYNGTARNYIARLNASGSLDTSFSVGTGANGFVYAIALQPDGKALIGGLFTTYNGTPRNYIARLNADGSLDASFSVGTGANGGVYALALQADGKVLIGGQFTTYNGTACNRIARLNADGSLDSSFNLGTGASSIVSAFALQPDGKVLIGGSFSSYNGTVRSCIARLNADGGLDTSFSVGTGANGQVYTLALQPDGKVLIGGQFTNFNGTASNRIARLNTNGSLDTSFNVGTGANSVVYAVALQPDGKVLIGGNFTSYNGTARNRIARLNADGSLDTSYNVGTGASSQVNAFALQSDGNLLVGGNFLVFNGFITSCIARLNGDCGSADEDGDGASNCIDLCPNDPLKLAPGQCGCGVADNDSDGDGALDCNDGCPNDAAKLFAGVCGCGIPDTDTDADGTPDCLESGSFDRGFGAYPTDGFLAAPFRVYAAACQSDGRFVIGGELSGRYPNVARLTASGGYDAGFDVGTGALGNVLALAAQSDGKILVGGSFAYFNGAAVGQIVRLNAGGSLDSSFGGGSGANGPVRSIVLQPDGKILIGGNFSSYDGVPRNYVARLNANGTLDTSFDVGPVTGLGVHEIVLQPDGKLLVVGNFVAFQGVARGCIARFNSDGSLDLSFAVGAGLNNGGYANAIALQSDGKILIGGSFSQYDGAPRDGLARLNANGTLDASFDVGSGVFGIVTTLAVQSDGAVLIGGRFSSYRGVSRSCIARVGTGGGLDNGFVVGSGMNEYFGGVYDLAMQSDGKVLACGDFRYYNGQWRDGIVLLNPSGAIEPNINLDAATSDHVECLELQPDGKILIGGGFRSFAGSSRRGLARIHADGSLDLSFDPTGLQVGDRVSAIALRNDGKIVYGGPRVGRLNSDGSLDASFGGGFYPNGHVLSVLIQPDGKLLIGGLFTSGPGGQRSYLARLEAGGSLDTTFAVASSPFGGGVIGPDGPVRHLALQLDGKIIIGGDFSGYGGFQSPGIARLNADGGLDATFNVGLGVNGSVYSIALQADGKIVIGGFFSSVNGTPRANIARLNADGSVDTTFGGSSNGAVTCIRIQPDGRMLIGGLFSSSGGVGRARIARLNPNGDVDMSFGAAAGANDAVSAIELLPNGKVVLGGSFTFVGGVFSPGVARLHGDCSSADADGDGFANCVDGCPSDPLKQAPGQCGCGVSDLDSDGDGAASCIDGCPNDPLKVAPGVCGCGVADTDSDGDGTANCIDQCPNDPNKTMPGVCGCGIVEVDSDGDGQLDCFEQCPNDPLKTSPGICGCGVPDTDSDGDGTPDCLDGCPLDAFKLLPGVCGCGVADTDSDGDGTANCNDGCPNDPLKVVGGPCGCGVAETDSDGDGTANCNDGCPNDPLKVVAGLCGCGVADTDTDGDGVADCSDNCDPIANPSQADCDLDAVGDACEIAAGTQLDTNGNGTPDNCEAGVVFAYCTSGTTTNGCAATLSAVGTPSASASLGFTIQGSGIEGQKQTLLYYGVNGPSAQVWAPGSTSFKCVRQPVQRCTPQNSGGVANGCNGSYALDLASYLASRPNAIGNPLFAGEVFNAQLWFRDPPAPSTSSLSNALQFTMAP